jgi:hypothetical protein
MKTSAFPHFPSRAVRLAVAATTALTPALAVQALSQSLPLRLPSPTQRAQATTPRLEQVKAKNLKYPTFAGFREMTEIYIQLGRYSEAAACLRAQAALYRQKGLNDAAIIQETRAQRYETQVQFFVERPLREDEWKAQHTRATLEPPIGSYIGAFIDRDDKLPNKWMDENFQTHREPADFNRAVGKPHGSYFMYLKYGNKFPRQWLENCKAAGAIPHLAWEPKTLADVRDDKYLQEFAREAGKLNWPIFLRYASEMNGAWTPYHGSPKVYRDKFRLVHRTFKKFAPQVATVWCVNSVPREGIPSYYPGDDGCDWVGINVYSVPFYDNNPANPAFLDSPLALVDPVYALFKDRKPMAICEYAASHMASVDKKLRPDFAIEKMSLLYSALPRLYPRIKMVNWFNMNTLKHAAPGRQLNNYSLTEQPAILSAYRSLVSSDYFIGAALSVGGKPPKTWSYGVPYAVPRPLQVGQAVSGQAKLSLWVKSYVSRPRVYVQVDDRLLYAGARPGAHEITIDTRSLPVGPRRLIAHVFDDKNRWVQSNSWPLVISRTAGSRGGSSLSPGQTIELTARVESWLVDGLGLVSAARLRAGEQVLVARFDPRIAQSLMERAPIGSMQSVALSPSEESTGEWNWISLQDAAGQNVPLTPSEETPLAIPQDGAAPQTITGQLAQVLGFNGQASALRLESGQVLHLPRAASTSEGATNAPITWQGQVEAVVVPATVAPGAVAQSRQNTSHFAVSSLKIGGVDVPLGQPLPYPPSAQAKWSTYVWPQKTTRGKGEVPPPVKALVNGAKRPW